MRFGESGMLRLMMVFLFGLCSGHASGDSLKIGALLSLSGNWSNLGRSSEIIMQMAEGDINEYLKNHRATYRISVVTADTALDPEQALSAYDRLVSRGVFAFVGPQSSSEVATVTESVQKRGVPIISQGSTASSLASPGDHVYRIVPNDVHESEAMTQLLNLRGVKVVVPLWRDDVGNKGLHDSLYKSFTATGGRLTAGVMYGTDSNQNFDPVAKEAARQASEALNGVGGDTSLVALYTASFDEIVSLMKAAVEYPVLGKLRWYGGDGVVQSAALASDPTASGFAMSVDYLSPNLGLSATSAAKAKEVSARYRALTGSDPDAFTLAAYDATWIAALAVNGKKSILRKTPPDPLLETADLFFGATGWTSLDANGDRSTGDYDFWGLRPDTTGAANWVILCHYDSTTIQMKGADCSQ